MIANDTPAYRHPEYDAHSEVWRRCRDVVSGQDAVHAGGESYLSRLSDQTRAEYDAYKQRTPFYNATGRTLDGLVGMIFRKSPAIDVPAAMEPWADDLTLSGVDLVSFTRDVVQQVQAVGRVGVLVEYPRVDAQPSSLAGALALNLRPYATMYQAESVINWRVERINNVMAPTLVVLSESYEVRGQFAVETKPQIRALMLDGGAYVQRIYRTGDRGAWEMVDEVYPLRNGATIDHIPFVMFGAESNSFDVSQPPLLDLTDLNLSHYRTSADLEHGAHFTGLPTPFIAGVTLGDNEVLRIGSANAIVSPYAEATARYLEFTGQGLGALEKLMDRKEAQMAAIGARMLAPEKASAEAAGTVEMRHSGETSVLAALAKLVSAGMNRILQEMAAWGGIAGTPTIELSTDYLPAKMTAQELTALVGAWQSGAISKKTLFWNLQWGEVVAPDATFEAEEGEIESAGPALGMINASGESGTV